MKSFDWIADQPGLDRLVDDLIDSDAYALDTEFHRERTYLPQLALVQLATRGRLALVDALVVDVAPLGRAFESDAICTMHAGSQDLEILHRVAGELRMGGHLLGRRAALAHDQLQLAEVQRLVPAQVPEGERAHDGHGVAPLVLAVEVRDQLGPLR